MAGLSPTLGKIGVLFEFIKFFLPMVALYAFQTNKNIRGLVLTCIGLLLVAMSFTASFIAVDAGFDENRKESAEFLAINHRIELLSDQAKRVTEQADLLPVNYITKREKLNNQSISIENDIALLIGDRASLTTDSLADQFGEQIAIAAAIIIELLTIATTIALSLLDNVKPIAKEQTKKSKDTKMKKLLIATGLVALTSSPAMAADSWTTFTQKSEMTGVATHYATSPAVESLTPMSFPYSNTKSWLVVSCMNGLEYAYIGFSKKPNLQYGRRDMFGELKYNEWFSWGDKFEQLVYTQSAGSKFLHFEDRQNAIDNMISSSSMTTEFWWYGQGQVTFKYSLKGSTAAIAKMRNQCKG
ncbi:MAG: hypothetical protein COA84_14250 [Robiginitomaculum sp.]|nr:MAG: hypothetical protein COA84_14250 [Robiginitomaculum sp.]